MLDDARGWRLAEMRKRRGMTQEQVAVRMGVSVARVSQIESGDVSTQDALSWFVAALGETLVIANVRRLINPSPEIAEYLRRINGTLDPFGGRFRVHDTPPQVLEGTWGMGVIVIEFPDPGSARGWYESAAYKEIAHLRTDNLEMDVIMVDGVPDGYRADKSIASLPFVTAVDL